MDRLVSIALSVTTSSHFRRVSVLRRFAGLSTGGMIMSAERRPEVAFAPLASKLAMGRAARPR
jgi:hypothetical protein